MALRLAAPSSFRVDRQAHCHFPARRVGSLLHAVGMPDLVTWSFAEYERLAVQLGTHPPRVASYKR